MLIAPENIYENRLFKNVTLNFSTVSKNKDNLVFILGSKYSDYNTVFKSKLFKPNQLYSVFAPRAIRLFNGKIVRIKQVDLYDQIMNETNGFIRMGKIIPNSYNEYNVLYDILPEYSENNNLLSKMYKNQSAILHGRLTKTLSDVIRNGVNTFGYKKNYVVVPITEAYSQSIRNLIKLKSYPVFNPAIEFIKILDPESEYNHDVLTLIDRVIFINPDSQTTFVIDPNNPETMKDFSSILLKIIRLYNYNNGQDNLEDIGNIDSVIEKDIDNSAELKLSSAKIESIKNDEYDDTKEKIVNAVLSSVGKKLKTKLTDFNSATIEEKGLINSINNKQCDMIIFGGDIYENGNAFDQERLISLLDSIQVPYGKFAVLGENEFMTNLEDSINLLESGGFEVLRNEVRTIYYESSTITLVGMESSSNLDSLLTTDQQSGFVIAAIHQPDYFTDLANTSMDLQLSGHTGGGFIQIPFVGPLVKLEGGETYVSGRYEQNNKTLIVSNGIGLGHQQQYRFNARPDAYVLTLSKRTNTTVSSSDASN